MTKRAIFIIAIFCVLATGQTVAQGMWVPLGLDYEAVRAIIVHPEHDNIIYAGTYNVFMDPEAIGGIFKSTDGGATWDTLVTGGISVECMVMHPMDYDIIYAGLNAANGSQSGIIKTTNGGQDWFWSHDGIYVDWETLVNTIAIDPLHPDTLFAGTGGSFGGELYKSTNAGLNWQVLEEGQQLDWNIACIAFDPIDSQNIYLGTWGEGYLYKSTDGGNSWWETPIEMNVIRCITVDPVTPSTVYVGAYPDPWSLDYIGAIFKSVDAGSTWTYTSLDSTMSGIDGIIIHPVNHDWLFMGTGIGFVVSSDAGETWDIYNEGLPYNVILSLACNTEGTNFYGYCPLYGVPTLYERQVDMVGINPIDHSILVDRSAILQPNFPNPFNPSTTIAYHLLSKQALTLRVYNASGQLVRTLVDHTQASGAYEVQWDGRNDHGQPVSSGLYLYRLETGSNQETRRMALLK